MIAKRKGFVIKLNCYYSASHYFPNSSTDEDCMIVLGINKKNRTVYYTGRLRVVWHTSFEEFRHMFRPCPVVAGLISVGHVDPFGLVSYDYWNKVLQFTANYRRKLRGLYD